MANSFSSWNSINERNLSRGKQVIVDPQSGKRQKIAYKVQSDNKILIRLVRMLSIVDPAGNITPQGASILVEFMNTEMAILAAVPGAISGINDAWFKTYAFIYTVKKDTQTREDEGPAQNGREKIQLTVVDRADFPMIPAGAKFVNASVIQGASADTSPVITDIIQDNQQTVQTDDTDDGANIIPDDQTEEDAEGTEETADLAGKRFRYTMRTNNKTYLMEFTEDGAIEARTLEVPGGPNGVVSYETSGASWKIMWITDYDAGTEPWTGAWNALKPLYKDQEITNRIDRDFVYKMFTNKEFRDKILAEYEAEYGDSEITSENLRRLLYYKNGNAIFAEQVKAQQSADGTGNTEVSNTSLYKQRTF